METAWLNELMVTIVTDVMSNPETQQLIATRTCDAVQANVTAEQHRPIGQIATAVGVEMERRLGGQG